MFGMIIWRRLFRSIHIYTSSLFCCLGIDLKTDRQARKHYLGVSSERASAVYCEQMHACERRDTWELHRHFSWPLPPSLPDTPLRINTRHDMKDPTDIYIYPSTLDAIFPCPAPRTEFNTLTNYKARETVGMSCPSTILLPLFIYKSHPSICSSPSY